MRKLFYEPPFNERAYAKMITENPGAYEDSLFFRKQPVYDVVKRFFDILLSLVALIGGSFIFLLIAIAIKLKDKGPLIYYHNRLGRNGKVFKCYKFRTMVPDAEKILQSRPELMKEFTEGYKLKDDPRITPLGSFLRKSSLDEIPQFYNVLRGEMSLIGPRPVVPPEIERYGVYGEKLLCVKPGLSGMWQAYGRSSTTYKERVEMDMIYIDNRSILLDIKLAFMTVAAVFAKRGAC
jgi:lipopolysaccharide/colanic/teichoic acid biosynthesis glycosyltransferase